MAIAERPKYEQMHGNKRYQCACGQIARHSAEIPFQPYKCPATGAVVSVSEQYRRIEEYQRLHPNESKAG